MLAYIENLPEDEKEVSVAGCLGYDVLGKHRQKSGRSEQSFSCWLFRL